MTDFDPGLYDLETEPFHPAPLLEGLPVGDFVPERAPYLAWEPPSAATSFFAPFAGGVPLGRQAPPWAALVAGLLSGIGQARLARYQQGELERREQNRRFESAAAIRNRLNLVASGRAEARRIEALQRRSEQELKLAAAERERLRGQIKVPWTGEMVERSSLLGQHVAGGGTQKEWGQRAAVRLPAGTFGSFGEQFDPDAIADGIADGSFPPDPSGYSRGQWGMVATSLRKRHQFDMTRAQVDWRTALRYYAGLNTNLQLRLRQAIENGFETARVAQETSDTLEGLVPRTSVTLLNRGLLTLAREGGLGDEATAAAQRLVSFVNALQFELANVYMGGGVPTDQASHKAREIVNPDMSPMRLRAALNSARQELAIRRNAISQAGMVSPSNPPSGIPQTGINLGGRRLEVVGTVRMRAPDGRLLDVPQDQVEEALRRGATRVP